MSQTEKFSLYWWDNAGKQHLELQCVPADEEFTSTLTRLTQGPAATMGVVTKVKVTDNSDYTNFLWENGKLIYPTRADIEAFQKTN